MPLKISLEGLLDSKNLLMKNFEIPALAMKTAKMSIFGKEVSLPVGITTDNEITMTFYVDDDFITRDSIDFWIKSIDKSMSSKIEGKFSLNKSVEAVPKDKYSLISGADLIDAGKNALFGGVLGMRTCNDFLGAISIKPLNVTNMRIVEYMLWNVYPKRVEAIKLDTQETSSIAQVSATFAFTHYTRKPISLIDSVKDLALDSVGL